MDDGSTRFHFVDVRILLVSAVRNLAHFIEFKTNPSLAHLCCSMQVFDISSLQIFTPQELDNLLCGRRELWEVIFAHFLYCC